ncbi:TPA_asm: relaxase/mobilization nuclease domain-containing protein [Salmonella enterica subsp. enterica serovar Litchfield]|uniref:Relaxase/mobilization nuclease domain-containing protein n=2 Tax=Salmonella enterica subsp. enterica serovar Litchfield TaxID=486998 RepID=A0A6W0PEI2_SALET|nr:relaxase/mobilization nuclease domain-containing protein [Salmonella enterica subsp. enterica serovar Litchfield]EEW9776859.1 relaxase/mobilization nuclease domain-containing protein [Salmonella enterica subsp. enterica serovar Litchfield]HAA1140515.1 relaxase/mobilization nuclease domain-containing protein [Salmonella enterica subsp. enterica serovar Litchfield]HAA1150761.1 relaxase/mobilization nuclease domain-containing protein [Salmonella enterica subsp. enterica serovar Litchfield]
MKGNVGKHGKSFKNRVKYILKDDHDFICSNMTSDSNNINELTDEFKSVSKFRQDIKKPVFHAFLSLPQNENITDEKWEEIAKDYLKEMNIDIEKHQYICVRHKDTDKDHIHIVANRIGLDGSVWHGQHDLLKTISACERLEVKHNLTITDGLKGQKSEVSAPTKAEIEMALRTGEKPARIVLQNALQTAMTGKPDLETFVERLQAVGIEPRFNVASTGNVAGCSFSVGDVAFKGSQLGKKFSWNTIKEKVKYDKNRDDELIRSFSARKDDEPDNIGRSPIEPNINDGRASDRIDDDIIGVSQHSIKSDATDTNKSEQLIKSNNNSFKLSEKYNRPSSTKVRRTTQKAAQILNRVKKQYNKEPIKTYNQNGFNIWRGKSDSDSIGRILDHAETANAATNKFRLKSGSCFNSRAAKIEEVREKLGIKKPIIQPKYKEKVIKEEIKKKPVYISEYENRFKLKLKENIKKEQAKKQATPLQHEEEQHLKPKGFSPR